MKVWNVLLLIFLMGCSSIGQTHQRSLVGLYSANDELAMISCRLSRIERVMLYAGRIHNSPMADDALDVAISIHGEPDITEKSYAENITPEIISHERENVSRLIEKREKLQSFIAKNRLKLFDESAEINRMEGKYNFFLRLICTCAIGLVIAVASFIIFRIF